MGVFQGLGRWAGALLKAIGSFLAKLTSIAEYMGWTLCKNLQPFCEPLCLQPRTRGTTGNGSFGINCARNRVIT